MNREDEIDGDKDGISDSITCHPILHLFSTSNHNSFPGNVYRLSIVFLSLFYIKPQLARELKVIAVIVFYLFSTSNHNG